MIDKIHEIWNVRFVNRIITATHKDLYARVREGLFNVIPALKAGFALKKDESVLEHQRYRGTSVKGMFPLSEYLGTIPPTRGSYMRYSVASPVMASISFWIAIRFL
jgi:hypothetical protein